MSEGRIAELIKTSEPDSLEEVGRELAALVFEHQVDPDRAWGVLRLIVESRIEASRQRPGSRLEERLAKLEGQMSRFNLVGEQIDAQLARLDPLLQQLDEIIKKEESK